MSEVSEPHSCPSDWACTNRKEDKGGFSSHFCFHFACSVTNLYVCFIMLVFELIGYFKVTGNEKISELKKQRGRITW